MNAEDAGRREALHDLAEFHADVDRAARAVADHHRDRLRCRRGCADCCVDDLTVFGIEAERIRHAHGALLRDGQPAPTGRCAFLDRDGACRVYDVRPYVCRTQGLPLRWLDDDGEEYRDICPLNDDGPAVVDLAPESCWTLGPAEGRLAGLQQRFGGGSMDRVRLRDLFGGAG